MTYYTPHRCTPKTVYFIRPVGMKGPIKIGCSESPERRRSSLDTWSPFPLEIVAEISGTHVHERRFHALFWDQHERREWFRWSPLFDEVIAAINAGAFDLDALPAERRLKSEVPRAKWSDEQRLRASYSHRCRRAFYRTGYHCRPSIGRGNLEAIRAELDAYLADPVGCGDKCDADWARAVRGEIPAQRAA